MQAFLDDIRRHSIEYGSIPFWSWNDRLDPAELRRQIGVMQQLGMHGFFMHARSGLETEYLSDEWYDCINACVDEAEKRGMEAWSYDENGWPSGFAGGKLLEDPANHASVLKHEVSGSWPEGDDVLGVYRLDGDRLSRLTAPAAEGGPYHVVRQAYDGSYVDTLDGSITRKFIALTHEDYKKRIGSARFGKAMPGFFTDEPQYWRWGTPYSNTLPAAFAEKYGYDIRDGLPALFIDYDGAEAFRYDYYKLLHERFIHEFVQVIYEWCEDNGCQLTGHAVEESNLSGQMWCCGGVMPFYEYEHIPGIDYLTRNLDTDISARQLGSVCAQLGRKKAISEMYGCCGWDVSPNELKRIAELQYAGGVNLMCQHLYPYSERGQRKRDYPAHYSEHQPWQEAMREFNAYFNHLGYLLSRGTEPVDTLILHPIHGAYLHYKRAEDRASIAEMEDKFAALVNRFGQHQVPFHFGDENMMARLAKVEGDTLCVGLCRYKYVVLPCTDGLDGSTAALLQAFLAGGGRVYLSDRAPTRVDGRPADLSWLRANATFADLQATAQAVLRKDGHNLPSLRQMVRGTDNGRYFFTTNLSGDTLAGVEMTIPRCANVWELDLQTLEPKPVMARRNADGSLTVQLSFEDSEAHFLVESDALAALPIVPRAAPQPMTLDGFRFVQRPVNALTLDRAELSYDGVQYERSRPIMLIKDLLLRQRYAGDVYLKFHFQIDGQPGTLRVCAEPLPYRSVSVNGKPIALDGDWWLDRSFVSADLAPYCRAGDNELVMRIDYRQSDYVYYVLYGGVSESLRNCLNFDVELECVYLYGNFSVRLDAGRVTAAAHDARCYDGPFSIAAQTDEVDLRDVVLDGYPFFAGALEVETVYSYAPGKPTELWLTGRYAVCQVFVNGQYAAQLMFKKHVDLAPYLREGDNTIRLKLYNSNRNLLGPHHFVEPEPYGVSPTTFSLEKCWEGEQSKLYASRYAFVRFGVDVGEPIVLPEQPGGEMDIVW